jgi:hypothetical protein
VSTFDSDTHSDATAALSQGLGLEESQPDPVVTQDVSPETPQSAEPTQGRASRDIDLSELSPEARLYIEARERELTADYTRKTQTLADQRREAEQALQFIEALNTDSQFAQQVYDTLGEYFGAGPGEEETFSPYDQDPYSLDESDDPYHRELQELKEWKNSFESQLQEARLEAQINNQLAQIRQANPSFTDNDISNILGFGFVTNGDLLAATDQYKAMQEQVLDQWILSKGSVTAPSPLQGGSGSPVQPNVVDEIDSITDGRLRDIALERIRNELG